MITYSINYEGETLGFVGEKDMVKCRFGRSILQLIQPSEGSVKYKKQELTRLKGEELRRMRTQMQIIFQNPYSSLNPRRM